VDICGELTFDEVHLDLACLGVCEGAHLAQPLALGHLLEGWVCTGQVVGQWAVVTADQLARLAAHGTLRVVVFFRACLVFSILFSTAQWMKCY